jgi:hypothetical protein
MSTCFNQTVDEGSTHAFVINVIGGPEDLEGYVGSMQIRPTKTSEVLLAEVAEADITVNHLTRQITVVIPDEETATYEWSGRAAYDLYIEGPGGDRWRVVEGTIRVSREVTREV